MLWKVNIQITNTRKTTLSTKMAHSRIFLYAEINYYVFTISLSPLVFVFRCIVQVKYACIDVIHSVPIITGSSF